MKQFDIPKKNKGQDKDWDKAFDALDALADELESESNQNEANNEENENEDEDIEEGAFDGQEGMTAEEVKNLEKMVKPAQRVLVKVSVIHLVIR